MVANLRNADEDLAAKVADGLGLPLPEPSPTTVAVNDTLAPSPKLSILANGPDVAGGPQVRDRRHRRRSRRRCWPTSPERSPRRAPPSSTSRRAIGGATLDDGSRLAGNQKVGGAPSVVYDVVAIVAAGPRRRRVGPAPRGEGLPHRRPRPRQVHRLDRPRSAPRRDRADRQGRRRLRRADRGQRNGLRSGRASAARSGNGPWRCHCQACPRSWWPDEGRGVARPSGRTCRRGAGPHDHRSDRRDHPGHVERVVRIGPAPLRRPRPVHDRG